MSGESVQVLLFPSSSTSSSRPRPDPPHDLPQNSFFSALTFWLELKVLRACSCAVCNVDVRQHTHSPDTVAHSEITIMCNTRCIYTWTTLGFGTRVILIKVETHFFVRLSMKVKYYRVGWEFANSFLITSTCSLQSNRRVQSEGNYSKEVFPNELKILPNHPLPNQTRIRGPWALLHFCYITSLPRNTHRAVNYSTRPTYIIPSTHLIHLIRSAPFFFLPTHIAMSELSRDHKKLISESESGRDTHWSNFRSFPHRGNNLISIAAICLTFNVGYSNQFFCNTFRSIALNNQHH